MPGFQPLTYVGSLGVVLPEQDGRINGGNQQHRDPVKGDRQGGETLTAIGWIHCKPRIRVSSWELQAQNALFLIKGLYSPNDRAEDRANARPQAHCPPPRTGRRPRWPRREEPVEEPQRRVPDLEPVLASDLCHEHRNLPCPYRIK